MNRHVVFLIVISLLLTGCEIEDGQNVSASGENMSVSGERVSNGGDLSENILREEAEIERNIDNADTDGRSHNYWYSEPDPQDTFMLRVEENISSNQAWVDFLKGEIPDYTGVDFSENPIGRAYTLQDMEGYSLDLWSYGTTDYVEDGGRIIGIQIFPYDIDADTEEELLFLCNSWAGLVKLWVLDEEYENTLCLYPSVSNWFPPGSVGHVWLWSDGLICRQAPSDYDFDENCPSYLAILRAGEGPVFMLTLNQYQSDDATAVYYFDYHYLYEDVWSDFIGYHVMVNRRGEVDHDSLLQEGNICTGPAYDEDLAVITQIYEETVGDAVPIRELTGLDGTEDGVIIVTREEFYSGAYLE